MRERHGLSHKVTIQAAVVEPRGIEVHGPPGPLVRRILRRILPYSPSLKDRLTSSSGDQPVLLHLAEHRADYHRPVYTDGDFRMAPAKRHVDAPARGGNLTEDFLGECGSVFQGFRQATFRAEDT